MENTNNTTNPTTLNQATSTRDELLERHNSLSSQIDSIRAELDGTASALQHSDELVVSLGGDSNLPDGFLSAIASAEGRRRTRIDTDLCDWHVMQALINAGDFVAGPVVTEAVCNAGFEISAIQMRASMNRLHTAGHVEFVGNKRSKQYRSTVTENPFSVPTAKAAKRTATIDEEVVDSDTEASEDHDDSDSFDNEVN